MLPRLSLSAGKLLVAGNRRFPGAALLQIATKGFAPE
jgi:hypothetical protein